MSLNSWNTPVIHLDKRALRVLTDLHWTSAGWRKERIEHPDLEYARRAGYIYEEMPIHHDEAVRRAVAIAASTAREHVADAFLASLSTRRLELRSSLGSYALAARLPLHEFVGDFGCHICCEFEGVRTQDLGAQNFERYRWGGVRHLNPTYMWFDLTLFNKTERPPVTEEDRAIFRNVLDVVRSSGVESRPGDIARDLASVLRSNLWERRVLLQILSYAGILEPTERPGFSSGWVQCVKRAEPQHAKNDWTYPFVWWRGEHGINYAALREFFPDFALSAS